MVQTQTEAPSAPSVAQYVIRHGGQDDAPFVFSSWLKSYRKQLPEEPARALSGAVYYSGQHELIDRLLRRSLLWVAAYAGDPDQILGWSCIESPSGTGLKIVHFVYVKGPFRRMGLGRALLGPVNDSGGFYSHFTPTGISLMRSKKLAFNPYAAGGIL